MVNLFIPNRKISSPVITDRLGSLNVAGNLSKLKTLDKSGFLIRKRRYASASEKDSIVREGSLTIIACGIFTY